jgi:hypothetical protein
VVSRPLMEALGVWNVDRASGTAEKKRPRGSRMDWFVQERLYIRGPWPLFAAQRENPTQPLIRVRGTDSPLNSA